MYFLSGVITVKCAINIAGGSKEHDTKGAVNNHFPIDVLLHVGTGKSELEPTLPTIYVVHKFLLAVVAPESPVRRKLVVAQIGDRAPELEVLFPPNRSPSVVLFPVYLFCFPFISL